MKKLVVFLSLLSSVAFSQAPKLINYQGVARDASGNVVTSLIGIKFEILQGSAVGTVVYNETNTSMPSSAGIFTTHIGSGTPGIGTFSASINWANGPYFIRVSIDPLGGTSYNVVGTSELVSVPYALYAETAGNAGTTYSAGPGISISSGSIINTAQDKTVTISQSGIANVTGTYPNFNVDVPNPNLNYNTGTNVLTLTQGTAVATTTLVGAGSNTVALYSSGIVSVTPVGAGSNFTIALAPPNFTSVGSSSLTGTYPNYTLTSPGASTLTPATLQINSPHTTTTLSPNNFSINVAPTSISGPGVLGSYPNYTLSASPTTTVTSGSPNVIVNGTAPSYTVSATTPTIQINTPNTVTSLGLNNYSITVPPSSVGLVGAGVASVSGTSPNYTVSVPSPTISSSGNTITITQGTAVATATFAAGPWATTGGVLHPAFSPTNDKVAIGQNTAASMLDVNLAASGTNTLNPVVYINNSNAAFNGLAVLRVRNSAGGTTGILMDQASNGDGLAVNLSLPANGSNAVQVNHSGVGNAGYFSVNNSTSNGKAIEALTSGLGSAISAVVSNTSNTSNALYVSTTGTGAAGYFNKSNSGYGVFSSHSGSSGTAGFFNNSNISNGTQALTAQTNGSGDAIGAYNNGTGRALYATNTNSATETSLITNGAGGRAIRLTNNGSNETVYMSNLGNGPVLYATSNGSMDVAQFNNSGTARSLIATNNSASETGFFNNSGTGRGLVVLNASSSANRAALINGGIDVVGKGASSTSFAAVITNTASLNMFNVRDDGNVGINVTNPGYRLSVFENANTNAAIYGSQSTAASSAGAHGVYGLSNNSNALASGVRGESNGNGPAVSGEKTSGSGPAAHFQITNATNTADGVFATTNGFGAAIHAVNGPTVSGGSNAALWLESGHLKSTQLTAPTVNTISVSGGGISSATVTLTAGSTDVKGKLNAVITTTGIVNAGNNFVMRVNFNKPYSTAPVVVTTPATDNGILHPFISGVSTTAFTVTVKNGSSGNMSTGGTFSLNLNYIVIE